VQPQDRPDRLTREELAARLAVVSHETYIRQAERDKGLRNLDLNVTDHDLERAGDAVRELERLGIFAEQEDEQ
jgi:hypothetical protein